jgi:hypothetical protein
MQLRHNCAIAQERALERDIPQKRLNRPKYLHIRMLGTKCRFGPAFAMYRINPLRKSIGPVSLRHSSAAGSRAQQEWPANTESSEIHEPELSQPVVPRIAGPFD